MKKSAYTKSSERKLWACRIASILLTVGPMIGLIIYGFIQGEPKTKLALGATILAAVALGIIGIIRKHMLRSSVWIVALGLWFALDKFVLVLAIFAATTFVDEIILTPLIEHYRAEAIANKAIDRRETKAVVVDEG